MADEIGDVILRIDGQLGVEVGNDEDDGREVIITSFSEAKLFDLVHHIVEEMSDLRDWRYIALKPPSEFAFALSVGNRRVEASQLQFAQMPDIKGGFRLILPGSVSQHLAEGKQVEELAWLVVEN